MPFLLPRQSVDVTVPAGQSIIVGNLRGQNVDVLNSNKNDPNAPIVRVPLSTTGTVYGPYPNGANLRIVTGEVTTEYVVGTAPVLTALDGGGNSGVLGPYAAVSALQVANPASTNSGKTAYVGFAAPYVEYFSNGQRWMPVLDALSVIPGPTVYNVDGTTSKRCMPKNSRIMQKGVNLFSPTALSSTAARTVVLDTTGAFLMQSEDDTKPGVLINCITSGFVGGMAWGATMAMPSDGLTQALVWVADFENGEAWSTGSMILQLTGASGNVSYSFSATIFRPGWNTLQLWNPATAADAVCAKAGITSATVTGYNFTDTITSVGMTINNAVAGANIRFMGIWSQTKVKPMVCMTFDVAAQNVFTNFIPAWSAFGFAATLRSGGDGVYRAATWNNPLQVAYGQGYDVNNGSWQRVNLNTSTTSAAFAREVGLQANYMQEQGYKFGSTLFSSAGNGLPKASIYRDIFPKFGIKSAKSGGGLFVANFFGPAGLDDRYAIAAKGYPGITVAKAQIDGAIYTGSFVLWFGHDCPTGRPSVGSVPASNGGGIYAEDVPELGAYLAPLIAAGSIEVVVPSQYDAILDGQL